MKGGRWASSRGEGRVGRSFDEPSYGTRDAGGTLTVSHFDRYVEGDLQVVPAPLGGREHHPRTDPVVIMLVTDGDRLRCTLPAVLAAVILTACSQQEAPPVDSSAAAAAPAAVCGPGRV